MPIVALGINHKTAPVSVRERVAFNPEQMTPALKSLTDNVKIDEAAILSTCNRTEIYYHAEDDVIADLVAWLEGFHQLEVDVLTDCLYSHRGHDAVKHMMRVASGLDSLVLGEPQILGQMKTAFNDASTAGTLGQHLERLFQQTFSVAKQVRTDTEIGQSPVSVAYAAVTLSKHIFADLSEVSALFIGAGETVELAIRHLHNQGVRQFTVANRTVERAENLAEQFSAKAIALQELPQYLPKADIVISSTASPLPIVGKGLVEKAINLRKHKPIFMVDLAVPRDIEQEVGELNDVYLYTVDDLQEVINENLKAREQAAAEAEDIIAFQSDKFMGWLKSLDSVSMLRQYREQHDQIREQELIRALEKIRQGGDAEAAMAELSTRLTNKFLHLPTRALRDASSRGDSKSLDLIRKMFLSDKE